MLGKLLKYEIKATARIFLPLYPIIIALALLNKILFVVLDGNTPVLNIPRFVSVMIYVIMIVAIFIITFIVTIQRFYKNLIGEEGYLMFTLPVKESSLIFSKLIVATMWNLGSVLVTLISIFVLLPSYDFMKQLPEAMTYINKYFNAEIGVGFGMFLTEMFLALFIGIVVGTLMIYASIALGHLANRNKILCSFGAFLGLSVVAQTFQMVITTIMGKSIFSAEFFSSAVMPSKLFNSIMLTTIVIEIILGVGYFFVTKGILSKKLNLE